MSVLITGINGFAGSHLAEYLLGAGADVCGTVLSKEATGSISPYADRVRLYEADIRDENSLQEMIEKERPQEIYHLAGISFVKDAWDDPMNAYEVNFTGTFKLYDAVARSGISARVLFVSSSEVYGKVEKKRLPLTEEHPLRPVNPYAVSKAAAELLGYQFSYSGNIDVISARAFNHIGPGQGSMFVCSSFARQVAEIEAGMREPVIRVGNLDIYRDFTDVRDIVHAYQIIMKQGKPLDVYNVCSGEAVSIRSVLERLIAISKVKVDVVIDESRLRPVDIEILQGDNSKVSALGWKKEITLHKSLEDIINYWRAAV